MRLLLAAALLLLPVLACAVPPTANLSITVVPASPCGALPGSFCPPGVTLTNVFDEEMSKGFLSPLFQVTNLGDGSNCNCYSDGVHGWGFPGDGTLTMNGWAAESISPTGKHGGATIGTTQAFNTPGYYEIKAIAGSDWNGWFALAGAYQCPPGPPVELDFFEVTFGRGIVQQNMTTGCDGQSTNLANGTDTTHVHVYGLDVSTSRGLTAYVDGVQKGNNIPYANIPGGLCLNAATCGTGLWLQAGGPGGDAVPMKVYWMRYYTEAPQ